MTTQNNNAKQLIEKIQREYLGSSQRALQSLAGANRALKKNFSRYDSFLMEFLQNAEDEGSSSIKFELSKDSLSVINDGNRFTNMNVDSICSTGISSKRTGRYIGYLGVGFKSIFLISNAPEIYSGKFQFKFDRNHKWKEIKDKAPYEVLPIWIEECPENIDRKKTTFILPIKRKKSSRISKEFSRQVISSQTILFLKNIHKIELVDLVSGVNRKIIKEPNVMKPSYEQHKIREYENGSVSQVTEWVLFKRRCRVPNKVKKDETTIDWERHEIKTREVAAAFRIENDILEKEVGGTVHVGLFSFLPIKEEVEGLNYILQGDFLTGAGRENLARDNQWNNWIADELTKLVTGKCITTFLKNEKWRLNFTDILFSKEGGHQLVDKRIKRKINRYLENNNVLISNEGELCGAKEAHMLQEGIFDFFSKDELSEMFPGKKILHPNCVTSRKGLKVSSFPYVNLLEMAKSNSRFLTDLLRIKARKRDIEFFQRFYIHISEICDSNFFIANYHKYNVKHDEWITRLASSDIMLTNRFQLSSAQSTFIKPRDLTIPQELRSEISVVHPRIAEHDSFESFKNSINSSYYKTRLANLKVLSKKIIGELVNKKMAKELTRSNWDKLPNEMKLKQIGIIKGLWVEHPYGDFDFTKYDFLTLKTKSSEWIRPSEIILSEEYEPNHRLEKLCELGLYDKKLNYLSPEYLTQGYELESGEIDKWRKFFLEIGVDDILKSKQYRKIVERISIILTIQYENKHGRKSTEIGQSEKEEGDVKSEGQGKKRLIEVKGTSKNPDDYTIELSSNQTENVYKGKTTHLYIICDIISHPHLFVIKSEKIKNRADWQISLNPIKWNNPEMWQDNWLAF